MTLSSTDTPLDTLIATVHDRALLLFLPHNEMQTLWRFDLDALAEHGFRVIGRDGFYELHLCYTDGTETLLARFLDKQEAHQTLHLIHSALVRHDAGLTSGSLATCPTVISQAALESTAPVTSGCGRRSWCKCMLGWLTFWRLMFLIGIGALLAYLLSPVPVQVPTMPNLTAAAPPAPVEKAAPTPPNGVPLDADQALPD